MHRIRRTAVLAGALVLLSACTDGGSPDDRADAATAVPTTAAGPAAPTSRSSAGRTQQSAAGTGSPGAEPTEAPAFPADTSDDGGPAQPGAGDPAGSMQVSGLRLSTHEGYDRLVIDLNTGGVPRWRVGYSAPTGPGGGPVDIDGDAFLRVSLDTGARPSGQGNNDVRTSGLIAEVCTTGWFEGTSEVLIGVRGGRLPFRAFALTGPGRIVIDVRQG